MVTSYYIHFISSKLNPFLFHNYRATVLSLLANLKVRSDEYQTASLDYINTL
jgi:hypothetical protein